MSVRKVLAAATAAAAIATSLTIAAAPAQALSCYEVGFDHLPGAWAQTNPPKVGVDDGDPYVRQYPCLT